MERVQGKAKQTEDIELELVFLGVAILLLRNCYVLFISVIIGHMVIIASLGTLGLRWTIQLCKSI